MKAIIVTGTPATGKSTTAKTLAKKLKLTYIDVNKIIDEKKLSEGFDKQRDCKIIDEKRLSKILVDIIQNSKKKLVIDSHMSHFIPKEYVELCIVTKCELKELNIRLKKRNYSEKKIKENMDAEIFDVCKVEAEEQGHTCITIETSEKGSNIDEILEDLDFFKQFEKKK